MRDVAALAQVSFKTVSRVVNGGTGVSPALDARVRLAIDELDFRPNSGARHLRRTDQRTSSIALLLEDVANRALCRLGRQHSTALVGFDDFQLADLLSLGITVVAQDAAAIGHTAAELLCGRIGGDTGPPSVRLVPTDLVRRGSGEIRAPR